MFLIKLFVFLFKFNEIFEQIAFIDTEFNRHCRNERAVPIVLAGNEIDIQIVAQ